MTSLEDYLYDLPDEKIAKYPLAQRDQSRLLKYEQGTISHHQFQQAAQLVPQNSLLVFNNTKVIAARLYFFKPTGAKIEIFLTDPVAPHADVQLTLKATKACTWKCIIGNAKKWKNDTLILPIDLPDGKAIQVSAVLTDRENGLVTFEWPGEWTFLDIIELAGKVPLPPYLNREAEQHDKDRYQTVFSKHEGAVAAPTAGLHFTDQIIADMESRGITTDYLTLHVSAGTFRPIKEKDFTNHPMHNEKIVVNRQNIENLLHARGPVIAVGTTAMRTLESTYWYGAALLHNPNAPFHIEKNAPYTTPASEHASKDEALKAILKKMDECGADSLSGETEIFIYPGYDFKLCNGLFTNYHQPGSTLILLVAAFIGDSWKKVYQEALENDYRFLSYGDTSLLLP